MGISEKVNLEDWVNEVHPIGDVLQIGFGLSCSCLQKFCSKNPSSVKSAIQIDEAWQDALPLLGMFDVILFTGKTEVEKCQVEAGSFVLQEGNKTLREISLMIPELMSMKYSDQDIDALCEQIEPKQKTYLSSFLSKLRENGQISQAQQEIAVEKYQLSMIDPQKTAPFPGKTDLLFECIQECLKHLRKKGRFSCLIGDSSRYEDPNFFEHFIANPFLDYQEKAPFLTIEKLD